MRANDCQPSFQGWFGTNQHQFFFLSHLLNFVLAFACCLARMVCFLVYKHHRAPGASVSGGKQIIRIVFNHAPRYIRGNTGL